MAPLVLPNNFKFKYFFGVQVLVENLVPPFLILPMYQNLKTQVSKENTS
jgi:hypothetical protein